MRTLEDLVRILREHKAELAERYGVRAIAVFGSFARGEQHEQSDVDIVVDLAKPLGLAFFGLWDYLESILGCRVDLLTPNALKQKPQLWETVEKDLTYA